MSKKQDNVTSLRASADTAVAKWRELVGVAVAVRAECNAIPTVPRLPGARYSATDFKYEQANIRALEAEAAAEAARHVAVLALDAAEIAADDEVAFARHPKHVHDDLSALAAEEAALQEQLKGVQRRRQEREVRAFRADVAHAACRAAADQPPSAGLPRPVFGKRSFFEVLTERVTIGEPTRDFAARIQAARVSMQSIAGKLEEKRQEEEAEAKKRAEMRAAAARRVENEQQAIHARERAINEETTAEAQRRQKLAADYMARNASGAAS